MLISMTGFGEYVLQQDDVCVHVEVKTVNNRFLKLSLRATEGYGILESQIESLVRQYVRRGTVQLVLRVQKPVSTENLSFNDRALDYYYDKISAWKESRNCPLDLNLGHLLALPGVVGELVEGAGEGVAQDWPILEAAIVGGLKKLGEMREREGAAMTLTLKGNIAEIRESLNQIRVIAPEIPRQYASKLTERVSQITEQQGIPLNSSDVIREVALFTDRCDISEEINRLTCHLDQFDSLLGQKEVEGRKLDFLTQEMNRETNTIGSKANEISIARLVIEIKAVIEKIREMVQNVE